MKVFNNKEGLNYNSFIYIWCDTKNDMYYIGSHLGSETDNYKGSGIDFTKEYKNRPTDFIRTILEYCLIAEYSELRLIEEKHLTNYNVACDNRFYNRTTKAYGGYHEKSVITRKNTLNELGENTFKVAAKKMVITRKSLDSYNTAKIKEHKTKKGMMSEISSKISNTLTGSKWMHNNVIQKYVNKNEIDKYLNDDWIFGILQRKTTESSTKNRIAVNKDGIKKFIKQDDIDSYLSNGWKIGVK